MTFAFTYLYFFFTCIWSLTRTAALFLFPLNFAKSMTFVVDCCTFQPKQKCAHFKCSLHDLSKLMIKHPIFLLIWFQGSKMKYYFSCWSSWYRSLHIFGGEQSSLKLKLLLFSKARSCKRSGTLFKSLLFWLAGEVSWLAVEVLSPCWK